MLYIKLFQINLERDKDRICFCPLDSVLKKFGHVPADNYDLVFEGGVDCDNLEEVFSLFNADNRPGAKEFRSMSVSDVVAVEDLETGIENFYYCDSVGFQQINSI